ncbi:MAG: peptide-binding protein [Candidatus Adiutrix sp.]|jgi:peptide/nickel transport system substrate-binding protein|nr:peptide-binding protein [Candidatus Adiutrix sp.]
MSKTIRLLPPALSLLIWLAACQEAPEKEIPAAGPAPPAIVSGPVAGDALVEASLGEASNLIPALASDTASFEVIERVYDGLVKLDKDLALAPALAESWEFSEDRKTLTFKLRPGVRWHDGAPFTAADALFTYELMVDPNTPTAYANSFQQIEKAEAVDDLTFRVTYKRPLAKALSSWSFAIMPAHLLKSRPLETSSLARRPIGTGPYKLETWEAGQRVILTANDDYFEGRPHLDRVIIKIIPDLNAQMMELLAGHIDTMGLTPDQYEEKSAAADFKAAYNVFRYPAFSYGYLGFNLEKPLFQDKRVRRALAYAIDKKEIVDGVLLGLGRVANGPFKPDMWANNRNVEPYPFDQARARALLAEAGWADTDGDGLLDKAGRPFRFTIVTNQGNKIREQAATIIQARLREIGVEVDIRVIEWAAFLKEYLDRHNFDALVMGWTIPTDPDMYDIWHSSKNRAGELNFISYKNEEVDRLVDEARFILDQAERKKAYDRVQEILHDDAPYVFLYVPDSLPTVSRRFVGPEVGPGGLGHNFNQWYVPLADQNYR